jgi:arylsulfatase A
MKSGFTFLLPVLFIFHSIGFAQETTNWQGSRPNIVFILTDDLGYGDLSCYGNPNYKTPVLDSMASEGVRFTRFYSMNTICSPSRAGLLTGLYPSRLGIADVFFPESYTGIGNAPQSIARVLSEAGYSTACIGKWHLGHHARHLPGKIGFQYYFGLPYSNDMANLTYLENDSIAQEKIDNNLITRTYTDKALDWLGKQDSKKPFFLYLAHNMPHVPLGVSPEFKGRSNFTLYGDVIQELDFSIGRIRKYLKDKRLDENTVIVFTSDNGPWLAYGPEGGDAGPLRNGKQTSYEGGIRIPCLVHWPAKIKGPVVSDQMALMADWFSTLSGWAGSKKGMNLRTDGKQLDPLLQGQKIKEDRELASYYVGTLEAYILGNWKIHKPKPGRGHNAFTFPEPKSGWQLYDLASDPGETKNLVASQPAKFKEMQDRLADFEKRMGTLPKKMVVR